MNDLSLPINEHIICNSTPNVQNYTYWSFLASTCVGIEVKFDTIGVMKLPKLSLKLPKGRDLTLHVAMLSLGLIGTLMVTSASMTTTVVPLSLVMTIGKQLFFLVLGYLGYSVLARNFNLDTMRKSRNFWMMLTLVALLIPLGGHAVNGAKAWIVIPGLDMTIQPSEFAKMIVVIMMSVFLGDNRKRVAKASDILQSPLFFVLAVILVVIVLQSDLGSGIVILIMAFGSFMLAGHPRLSRLQWGLLYGAMAGVLLVFFVLTPTGIRIIEATGFFKSYQLARFKNALNPFLDKYGTGYQLVNGLVAFVRGGWFGVGYGNGLQKYGYLPAAKTDFILAVIAEETGFAGLLLVFSLYFMMLFRLLLEAYRSTSEKHRMILVGVALYIGVHFIFNVGGVTALIPLTGVPLLMLSSGGSSTLALMFALGIAQNIIIEEKKAKQDA